MLSSSVVVSSSVVNATVVAAAVVTAAVVAAVVTAVVEAVVEAVGAVTAELIETWLGTDILFMFPMDIPLGDITYTGHKKARPTSRQPLFLKTMKQRKFL